MVPSAPVPEVLASALASGPAVAAKVAVASSAGVAQAALDLLHGVVVATSAPAAALRHGGHPAGSSGAGPGGMGWIGGKGTVAGARITFPWHAWPPGGTVLAVALAPPPPGLLLRGRPSHALAGTVDRIGRPQVRGVARNEAVGGRVRRWHAVGVTARPTPCSLAGAMLLPLSAPSGLHADAAALQLRYLLPVVVAACPPSRRVTVLGALLGCARKLLRGGSGGEGGAGRGDAGAGAAHSLAAKHGQRQLHAHPLLRSLSLQTLPLFVELLLPCALHALGGAKLIRLPRRRQQQQQPSQQQQQQQQQWRRRRRQQQ